MNQMKILESYYGESKENNYYILNEIGKGGFAVVYRGKHVKTGRDVAIKAIPRSVLQTHKLQERINQEISIHQSLNHPSIVKFYDYCEDDQNIYLIIELCTEGNLEQLIQKLQKPLHEDQVKKIVYQIAGALLYLQSKKIMHRDLKLSNLLIDAFGNIKIADFGLATQLKRLGQKNVTMCGTPNYISPEVATRSPHGVECDIWALGCITYTLLVGRPPFDRKGPNAVLTNVVISDYKVPTSVSASAKDLINRCLKKNPKERIDIQSVIQHSFFDMIRISKNDTSHRTDSGVYTLSTSGPSSHYSRMPLSAISENVQFSECRLVHPVVKDRALIIKGGSSPPIKLPKETAYINKKFASLKHMFVSSDMTHLTPVCAFPHPSNLEDVKHNQWTSLGPKHPQHRLNRTASDHSLTQQVDQSNHFDSIPKTLLRDRSIPEEISPGLCSVPYLNRKEMPPNENMICSNKSEANLTKDCRESGHLYCAVGDCRDEASQREEIVYDRGKIGCHPEVPDCRSHQHGGKNLPVCRHRSSSVDRLREGNNGGFREFTGSFVSCTDCMEKPRSSSLDDCRCMASITHRSWGGEEPKFRTPPPKSDFQRSSEGAFMKPPALIATSQPLEERMISCSPKRGSSPFYGEISEPAKPKKTLSQLCSPLSTRRLRATRQKTVNAILHILDGGDVCLEFIVKENKIERVKDVCRISHDGQRVLLYEAKYASVTEKPVAIPCEGTDQIYSYDSLPAKYFKKYIYASRFVKMVKAKTPKVTYYSDQAKCNLMENGPKPDFEAVFFSGEKVVLGKEKYLIFAKSGEVKFALSLQEDEKTSAASKENSIVHALGDDVKPLYLHAREVRDHCLQIEDLLTNLEMTKDKPNFPLVIGKRPPVRRCQPVAAMENNRSPSASLMKVPSPEGKENISPESVPTTRIKNSSIQLEPYETSVLSSKYGQPLSTNTWSNIQNIQKGITSANRVKTKYGWLIQENGYIALRYFDGGYTEACIQSLASSNGLKNIKCFDSENKQLSFYDQNGKLNPQIGNKLEEFQEVLGSVCRTTTKTSLATTKIVPRTLQLGSGTHLPKFIR